MPNVLGAFYVVVPVLNEAPNMGRLMSALRGLEKDFGGVSHFEIILIDDGSTDGTADQARQLASGLNLTVLAHTRNVGPGHAFGTAYEYLAPRLKDEDWVATMEGDNTSRHELLHQMFTRSHEGYEIILASPYLYGGGIRNTSPLRVFLSHIANAFLKECIGLHGLCTMSSFFRLHRGSAVRQLQACYGARIIERAGFEGVVEMLIKMVLLQMTISEVPMVLDTSLRLGKSKMKVLRTICSYVTLFLERGHWQAVAYEFQRSAREEVAATGSRH
jgi:glycosyltransferase involved in cell wall biosynthesis